MSSSSISARLTRAATLYGINGDGTVRVRKGDEVRIVRRLDVDPLRPVYAASVVRDRVEYAANVRETGFESAEAFEEA